jgi:hypothetical protein
MHVARRDQICVRIYVIKQRCHMCQVIKARLRCLAVASLGRVPSCCVSAARATICTSVGWVTAGSSTLC